MENRRNSFAYEDLLACGRGAARARALCSSAHAHRRPPALLVCARQAACYHSTVGHSQNLMHSAGANVKVDAQVVLIAAFAFSVLQLLLTHAHLAALAAQMAANAAKVQPASGV